MIENESDYELQSVDANEWSIGGAWRLDSEHADALAPGATLRFSVQAPAYNVVMDTPDGSEAHVAVTVDGGPVPNDMMTQDMERDADGNAFIRVSDPRLYRALTIPNADRHTIELKTLDGQVRFYSATFG